MSKKLIIVESPAKAKTISRFLGKDYIIKASMGHVRDLPKKEFGVNPDKDFSAKYQIDIKKKKIISELQKAVSDSEAVFLASDHDREGEAIAWHLVQVLQKQLNEKPVHRIIFNEITRDAILNAIRNPGLINDKKVDSQQARRILDRIVGYNVSPLLWKIITKNLSAGRVQSVALRIICEREDEIRSFQPREYWNIEAILYRDELEPFKAILKKFKNKNVELADKIAADEMMAQLKNNDFIISDIKESTRQIQPAPPYITSTLQQDAARILNFNSKKTMQIAQQLYEGIDLGGETTGLITYMRTDSLRVSNLALDNCRKLITERFGHNLLNTKTRVFRVKKTAQDAHEAIRPTDTFRTPESIAAYLDKDQQNLYSLIWQRFVATQMIPATLKTKNLDISLGDALFAASGSTIVNRGFLEAFPHTILILGEKISDEYKAKDHLICKDLKAVQLFTKPPARYSEASLIKELESLGIGRPSTYSSITNTIIERQYVKISEKKFYPTDLGMSVNKFLVSNFSDFFNIKFTATMENKLDKIEDGEEDKVNLLKNYYNELQQLLKNVDIGKAKKDLIETTDIDCEKCGHKMVIKWSRSGQFLACSNFPTCKNALNFNRDEEGKIKIFAPEVVKENCPQCGGELIHKKGRYGDFIACSNYPDCKFSKPITLGITCPECKKGELTEKKNKTGRFFYSCTNYPECKYISNHKPVALACPACNHPIMEEKTSKTKGNFKKCPACGHEVF